MPNEIQMTAGIVDGASFETVHYPDDEVLLRVTQNGNAQVREYSSSDREGPPPHSHQWDEIEYVLEGEVEFYQNGKWVRGGPVTVQMCRRKSRAPRRDAGSGDRQELVAIAARHGLALGE